MRLAIRIGILGCLAGCIASDDVPSRVQRADSLGIAVVSSSAPAAQWSLSTRPVIDLGKEDDDGHTFSQIKGIALSTSGHIAVVDASSPHVRLFDLDGGFVAAAGNSGDGPGELRWPASVMALPGDSLLVMDESNGRLTVFGPGLSGVATRRLLVRQGRPPSRFTPIGDTIFAALPDLGASELRGLSLGLHRPNATVSVFGSSGELLAGVDGVPWGDVSVSDRGFGVPILGGHTLLAGYAGELILGLAQDYSVQWMSPTGSTRQVARINPGVPLDASDELWASEIEKTVEAWGDSEGATPDRMRDGLRSQPRVARRPAYSRMLVDSQGHVWLGDYSGQPGLSPPTRWYVIAPDGSWAASINIPDRLTPFVITLEWVIGVGRNEYDVETVLGYRLHRRS